MDITIYTIPGCNYCNKIKELMKRADVDYTTLTVGVDITRDNFKTTYPYASGYPYTVIDGEPIGGLIETVKYFVEKGLVSSRKQ